MIELLNEWGKTWTATLGLSVIQDSIFLGILFWVLYGLRTASARIKYNVALIGLFKLVLPPFLPASFLQWGGSENMIIGPIMLQAVVSTSENTQPVLNIHALTLIGWVSAVILLLTIQISSTLRLKIKLRQSEKLGAHHVPGKPAVSLYRNPWITMPLTFGIFHKRIYVPEQWETWTKECRQMILSHELAHIQRKDGLMKTIQLLIQSFYFFHPLVWLLGKRLNEYREMACDDMSVTTRNGSNIEYSRYLVQIAETLVQTSLGYSSASALIRQKNELLNRVKYQLEGTMKHLSKKRLTLVLAPLVLILIPLSLTFSKPDVNIASDQKTAGAQIYGSVIDKETGEALPGANVYVNDTKLGAATDAQGKYSIVNVPPGTHSVWASFLGYKAVLKNNIGVKAGHRVEVNFEMLSGSDFDLAPPPPPPVDTDIVFVAYDEPPSPVDGFSAIQKKLTYPEAARKAGIEGRVTLYAFVDISGKVTQTKIIETPGKGDNGCAEAAVKAIQSVPWKPAQKAGKAVGVWIAVPVDFKMK